MADGTTNYLDCLSEQIENKNLDLTTQLPFTDSVNKALATTNIDRADLLDLAVASLNAFLQQNYTGPVLEINPYEVFTDVFVDRKFFSNACIAELEVDSEEAYPHAEFPHLLILSLTILKHLAANAFDKKTSRWLARAAMVQQSLLTAPSSSLHNLIFEHLHASAPDGSASVAATAEHFLEIACADIFYSYDSHAVKALDDAKAASGLKFVLTGLKALRTKYQEREIANLVVLARSDNDKMNETASIDETEISSTLPSKLELNSDLLLEAPKFSSTAEQEPAQDDSAAELSALEDANSPSTLTDIDSCILMLTLYRIKSVSPSNNPLTIEELLAYVSRVIASSANSHGQELSGKVNWTVFSRALWERSILESNSARTVERGTMQLASLVDELGASSASTAMVHVDSKGALPFERLRYIHILPLMPRWRMDLALATQYLSLGLLQSAQEIYERLELPIENALCTAAAGSQKEAVKILENYLAARHVDTARAWSVLGDITQKPEYWERAWEEGKYAGAKRSLGEYYFKRNQPVECIKHLSDALQKNPLNRQAWFLYGCAGLESEQYELAAEGFTRCVSMDNDDAKAWANLATALLHLGRTEVSGENTKAKESLSALSEACRLNPDDWRLWSNLVTVAARLENWTACLRGTIRQVELRGDKDVEDALDIMVLRVLAQVLVSEGYGVNANGEEKRHTLFERQAITLYTQTLPKLVTRTPELWLLVAKVEQWRKRPWAALDAYEKQFRLAMAAFESAETEHDKWTEAVETCAMLVDAYTNLGELPGRMAETDHDDTDAQVVCKDWKWRAKNTVRSLMAKGKRIWGGSEGWDRLTQMRDELR
ncbi:hypothetical protein V1512DRAFT_262077 [Lipomyces arxii]|uniref:uncharacterized protein n=1 Tax=Lipomyces arxii TaxID=56418 RepID=UPI0034CD78DA